MAGPKGKTKRGKPARARTAPRGRTRRALVACLVLLAAVLVAAFASLAPEAPGDERTITELTALVEQRQLQRAVVLDHDDRIVGSAGGVRFWTAYPHGDGTATRLVQAMAAAGIPLRVDAQTSKALTRVLATSLLPLLVLANLFALFFVGGGGGGSALGEVIGFGRLRRGQSASGATTFADVAGLPEAVEELREVVDYLRSPERYEALGAAPPKGVILFGPPGCGKTLLARAVAGEAGVPFFSVAGAEFVESLVGVGAARVRDLFDRVRAAAPAIVFIDELDAAGRRRTAGGGGSDERDQTLNQLLVEMDGFDVAAGVVVIAATNRVDIVDPALLRPGRFDRHITVELPDLVRRRAILELHAGRRPGAAALDLGRVAQQTAGFSGADLASVVNEATLLSIRRGTRTLDQALVEEAIDRVRSGPRKQARELGADDEQRLAVREAGRVVAVSRTGGQLERVSIFTTTRPSRIAESSDHVVRTEADLVDRLVRSLAPSAAEVLVLGTRSTAGERDLLAATQLAVDMVGRYGMSFDGDLLRHVVVDLEGSEFLGGGGIVDYLAPRTHAAFDAAVEHIIQAGWDRATKLLTRERAALDTLVEALLLEETLAPPDVAAALAATGSHERPSRTPVRSG